MTSYHEKAIQMCETQAKFGSNQTINAFANTSLPRLRDHLSEAKALLTELDKQ